MKKIFIFLFTIILIFLSFFFLIQKEKKQINNEKIVFKFGKNYLTKNEFLFRTEFNVRPEYCSGNTTYDKYVCLNSFIAEQLFSKAYQQKTNKIDDNFKYYLKGYKDQAIREELFYNEIWDKIKIDSAKIKEAVNYAIHPLEVDFIYVRDSITASILKNKIKDTSSFNKIQKEIYNNNPPKPKEVNFGIYEESIDSALFNKNTKLGSIIGPIKTSTGYYLMKINHIYTNVLFSKYQYIDLFNEMKRLLKYKESEKQWNNYIAKIMKGKIIKFNEKVFYRLALYFKEKFDNKIKQQKYNDLITLSINNPGDNIEIANIINDTFFTIDNEKWTVNDFFDYIKSNPLNFKRHNLDEKTFYILFQRKIAKLIKNYFLTKEGIKKGYDKKDNIKRKIKSWKDYYFAQQYIKNILREKNIATDSLKNYYELFEVTNAEFEKLKKQYKDSIFINKKLLDKIKLTSIQMTLHKKNQIYPLLTPPFPITTNSNKINYKILTKEK